jgi:HlyD family secretion protein
MKAFFRRRAVIGVIVAVALIVAGYFMFGGDKAPGYDIAVVEKGDISQEVSVTGRVEPAEDVTLAFEKSGRVSKVYKNVGDTVKAGDVLAVLDNSDSSVDLEQALAALKGAEAQLKQFEAALATQRAKLDELKKGTRPETIEIYRSRVSNAEVAVLEAEKSLKDKIGDAYTKSDDAIRNKVDQFFSNPRGFNPQLNFILTDSALKWDIENGRGQIEKTLVLWAVSLEGFSGSFDLDKYRIEANANLSSIKSFLDKVSLAVNSLTPSGTLTQTTIDTWRANVSTARANINLAITALVAAEEKYNTSVTSLNLAKNELSLQEAGATAEQIAAQEAAVKQAEANADSQRAQIMQAQAKVSSVQVQLNKGILRSPIDGVITKQDAKNGQMVTANVVLVSVISEADFEVVADISEADIAKIKIGNMARLTLDAYGDDVIFRAKVVKIDPAEIIKEGVATYKTTLQFEEKDGRVKSGMTANIDIVTSEKKDALSLPFRAVLVSGEKRYVRTLDGESIIEKNIETGIRGSNGNIEIVSGLREGEKVVIYKSDK